MLLQAAQSAAAFAFVGCTGKDGYGEQPYYDTGDTLEDGAPSETADVAGAELADSATGSQAP